MKSYVTLCICPICREETGELLVDRRLQERFDMHTVTPNVCDKCRERYLGEGVCIVADQSASTVVITDNAFTRMFNGDPPKGKIAMMKESEFMAVFAGALRGKGDD